MVDLMGRRGDMFTEPTIGRVATLENAQANVIGRLQFLDAGQDKLQKTVDKLVEEEQPRKRPRVADSVSSEPSQ